MPPLEPGEPGGAAGEAPPAGAGQAGAGAVLGALPRDLLAELCQRAAQRVQAGVPAADAPELSQRCRAAGVEIGPADLARAARALAWLFGTAARNKLSSEELSAELGKTFSFLPKQAGQVIRQVWNEKRKSLIESEDAKDGAAAGQLIDFQWKLGIAISADSCKSLKSPYVTVALKVADGSGSITCKTFEMTVPQFQNFYSQFKEMASVLETF